MALNEEMLEGAKDVIYNNCGLPDSVKEPIHLAIKCLFAFEYSYKDFLSREVCGETTRANPILLLIEIHGGDPEPFLKWFLKYENPGLLKFEDITGKASWGT